MVKVVEMIMVMMKVMVLVTMVCYDGDGVGDDGEL